ncbi:related to aminoglycoside acetyltransferase regulator from P. stuartii [Phialocephala subalpina]|uniref:Related to aminoglycoside acetyltransferase regulator from P. stuartii n=1 Tax=Phialocephala subalpina TaxID=576137 RepID=A0A1L7X7J5_9HELO|nr:related to aminoglycoside acetyltransferase regulator from P. stuartii [Phialocephala subalpina]
MRSALTLGRTCFRQSIPQSHSLPIPISSIPKVQCQRQGGDRRGLVSVARESYRHAHGQSSGGRGKWQNWNYSWRSPPKRRGLLLAATVGLSPAAFVQLSEKDNSGTEHTTESRMLAASRTELKEKKSVDPDAEGFTKFRDTIIVFLDTYIWEPVCTGLRFLHLVCIFVPVIVSVPVMWVGGRVKERGGERRGTLWWYVFLVRGMEKAGPAFIKLGQWAASRSDIFPTEMCEIMSNLHSNAPAHSLHATKRIITRAFDGRPFEEIFEEFQEKPLGVGAIAQVYKAKLKPDLAVPGDPDLEEPQDFRKMARKNVDTLIKSTPQRVPSTYVAIKVLHPGVERVVRRDLRIMGFFASILNAIPTIEWLSLPDEVSQFGEMMRLQLDLRIEAANLTIFRKNFKERTTAWFPYPHTAFTTRQVLVEEFAQGIPLSDFMENGGGVFQQEIADEGLDAFLRMLLLDNFVHADLHPGNIMVRFYQSSKPHLPFSKHKDKDPQSQPDVTEQVLARLRPYRHKKDLKAWDLELQKIDNEGFRPQLIFIDTGLVTELNATNRRNFLDLFKAVAEFDGYKAGHLMCERCRQPDAVIDEEIFALKMQHLVIGVKSRTLALGNMKIGDILNEVLGMVRSHHVRMEGDFVNVVISILLLEGIGRALNPDIDLLSSALPILRQLGAQSGGGMLRQGDFSMLKVWAGLEARKFLQASIEDVERCVKYDLLSPNV